jgi:predicted nucleic acid-binding protein
MRSVPESLRFLTGARVYFDTNVFIYGVEGGDSWRPLWGALWGMAQGGQMQVVSSELTLAEALVQPIRTVNREAQRELGSLLVPSEVLALIPISRPILLEAARLRALHQLEMPDAIHAATAKAGRCQYFLTNDKKLAEAAGAKMVVLQRLREELAAESN